MPSRAEEFSFKVPQIGGPLTDLHRPRMRSAADVLSGPFLTQLGHLRAFAGPVKLSRI
jgi:hypothetical protein